MDQVYLPKKRIDFSIGSYVLIRPIETIEPIGKLYFYNIKAIEPIKLGIINKMVSIIDKVSEYENLIVTGSFLEKGFNFNDIDVIVISEQTLDEEYIKKTTLIEIGVKLHLIVIDNKSLIRGLQTDPLYQMMLSRCVAKKRFIYKVKYNINYKILDLHLLKSGSLINNFDYLNGSEKYALTRNMLAIDYYLKNKKIDKEKIDKGIKKIFNLKNTAMIKKNMLDKKDFLKKYDNVYKEIQNEIMRGIKGAAKQK